MNAGMSTYKVIRFFREDSSLNHVVFTGMTLEEAQLHCNDPETSSSTAIGKETTAITEEFGDWFDGWTEE